MILNRQINQQSAQRRIGNQSDIRFVTNKRPVTAGERFFLFRMRDRMHRSVNGLQIGTRAMKLEARLFTFFQFDMVQPHLLA